MYLIQEVHDLCCHFFVLVISLEAKTRNLRFFSDLRHSLLDLLNYKCVGAAEQKEDKVSGWDPTPITLCEERRDHRVSDFLCISLDRG